MVNRINFKKVNQLKFETMNEQDLIKIINLIEYPDVPKTLRELGVIDTLKVDGHKLIAIFLLPNINLPNRKDIANSVRIMAESFGYKFEYDFREMNTDEKRIFEQSIQKEK